MREPSEQDVQSMSQSCHCGILVNVTVSQAGQLSRISFSKSILTTSACPACLKFLRCAQYWYYTVFMEEKWEQA